MDYSKVKFVKPSVNGIDITKGKVYPLANQHGDTGNVINDVGALLYIIITGCAHLEFKKWIPCDENGKELGDD